MPSGMYSHSLSEILRGRIDFVNNSITLIACSSLYLPSFADEQNQSDIPDGAFLAEEILTGNSIDGSDFVADPVTFTGIAAGTSIGGFVLSKDTGIAGTSTLIAFFDVTNFDADGTDIVVSFANDVVISL